MSLNLLARFRQLLINTYMKLYYILSERRLLKNDLIRLVDLHLFLL